MVMISCDSGFYELLLYKRADLWYSDGERKRGDYFFDYDLMIIRIS